MPLIVNLRTLAQTPVRLRGELTPAELELDLRDEIIQINTPIEHDLEVEQHGDELLVRGRVRVMLECECVRCLRRFQLPLVLDPYTLLVPLSGEEALTPDHDNADLTPWVRDDMLLELPQHPLCKADCAGLKKPAQNQTRRSGGTSESGASAWAALNKLKL